MAAEYTSPTTTTSRGPGAASDEATQQGAVPLLEEASTTPAALSEVLKWAGVALLVIAALMAVYLGSGLLGGWRCGLPIPDGVPLQKDALTLEEQAFHGNG